MEKIDMYCLELLSLHTKFPVKANGFACPLTYNLIKNTCKIKNKKYNNKQNGFCQLQNILWLVHEVKIEKSYISSN